MGGAVGEVILSDMVVWGFSGGSLPALWSFWVSCCL